MFVAIDWTAAADTMLNIIESVAAETGVVAVFGVWRARLRRPILPLSPHSRDGATPTLKLRHLFWLS